MAARDLRIETITPYENGRSFGPTGSYELTRGTVDFAVDPAAPANAQIVDLGRAPRGEDGLVEFSADFSLLQPHDPARSNGRVLFVVANRGRIGPLPYSEDIAWPPRDDVIDPGDGYLLREGWTIAWCGWQFDVPRGSTALGLSAPQALEDGLPIVGQVRVDFRSDQPIADHVLGDSGPMYAFSSYPALSLDDPDAVLTVRDYLNGPRQPIARGRWRFAHDERGRPVPDDERIWLEGGFEPFRTYEVLYRTRACPVVGTGLLAVRDFVAHLRASSGSPCEGRVDHTFAFGASQSGRFLRHFLHLGLNQDERGRTVFDGVHPHIGGGRLGEFNLRYGQPSHFSYSGAGGRPPFSPSPGGGLFDRQRGLGSMPKVVITNTAWEYWRGDAALNHIDPTSGSDLADAADTRIYFFAGTDHVGASPMKDTMPLANPPNRRSSILLTRAAFDNLVRWVTDGSDPPTSRVPRLHDGSASTREDVLVYFKAVPGARLPDEATLPLTRLVDHGAGTDDGVIVWPGIEGASLTCYVATVNDDGNERAGVRLPELAAPVATYTGWNPRAPQPGLPDVLYEFPGSTFGFARDAATRSRSGDPRSSIEERYASRDEYLAELRRVTDALVGARLLLPDDADRAVSVAAELY